MTFPEIMRLLSEWMQNNEVDPKNVEVFFEFDAERDMEHMRRNVLASLDDRVGTTFNDDLTIHDLKIVVRNNGYRTLGHEDHVTLATLTGKIDEEFPDTSEVDRDKVGGTRERFE